MCITTAIQSNRTSAQKLAHATRPAEEPTQFNPSHEATKQLNPNSGSFLISDITSPRGFYPRSSAFIGGPYPGPANLPQKPHTKDFAIHIDVNIIVLPVTSSVTHQLAPNKKGIIH
jgi:hypothetical protein